MLLVETNAQAFVLAMPAKRLWGGEIAVVWLRDFGFSKKKEIIL